MRRTEFCLFGGGRGGKEAVKEKKRFAQATYRALAVDAEVGVVLRDLPGLDRGELRDGAEATVLGEGHGDIVERVGEGAHRVLLDRVALVRLLLHLELLERLVADADPRAVRLRLDRWQVIYYWRWRCWSSQPASGLDPRRSMDGGRVECGLGGNSERDTGL